MFTILLATAAALTGLVSAQNTSTSGDTWFTQPIAINPGSVDLDLRRSWCTGQKNNCWKICGGAEASLGDAFPNECSPDTLDWTCTCTNGNSPNISDYRDTMPYYVCSEWRDQCTAAHPDDLSGITACQSITCGTRNASSQANSSPSASASGDSSSPSSTATPSSDSSDSSTESSTPSETPSDAASSDNAAVAVGMSYGTGILMVGMLAAFGMVL